MGGRLLDPDVLQPDGAGQDDIRHAPGRVIGEEVIGDDEPDLLEIALDRGGIREGIEHVRARGEQHIEPTLAYELRDGRHVAGHPGAWRASIGRGEIREVIARREGSVARAETAAGETELAGEPRERGHRPAPLPAVSMLAHT